MPGMMDTVLNLGLNDITVAGLAQKANDERFAWDSYRRFIQMYSDVVLGVGHDHFEEILDDYKLQENFSSDTDLDASDWQHIVSLYKARVEEVYGQAFPQNVMEQLWGAIGAVFGSWRNARAETYRRLNNIPESWELRLMCRRWCLVIWAQHRQQVLPLPVIPQLARTPIMASF